MLSVYDNSLAMYFVLVPLFLIIVWYVINRRYTYWKNQGVDGPKPIFPVGNVLEFFLMKKSMGLIFTEIYNEYPKHPFVGVYRGLSRCLIIREPEFIKNVEVKNFKSFYNNDNYVDQKIDPLLGRNPFVLKNQEWKSTRSKVTPCFTGGKMKFVFPLVDEICQNMLNYIKTHQNSSNKATLELQNLCSNFTIDSVASCAFGVDGKCFRNPNSEFKEMAIRFVVPEFLPSLRIFIGAMIPQVIKLLPIKVTPVDVDEKLRQMVQGTIKYRDANGFVRNDFIQMMWELHKKSPEFTMEDIVGQATAFFTDGYETSSVVMTFIIFEIAMSTESQTKLRLEILRTLEDHDGNLNYDIVNEMEYLNAVVLESLRKNPPLPILSKLCNKKYTYSTTDTENFIDKTVTIEPGTTIIIPMAGLHWNEQYFEDPKTFKPERFLNENKGNITKFTYIPFGEGLRGCLGQRFGIMQIKLAVIYLVRHFEISLNDKTKLPMELDLTNLLYAPKSGIWVDLKSI